MYDALYISSRPTLGPWWCKTNMTGSLNATTWHRSAGLAATCSTALLYDQHRHDACHDTSSSHDNYVWQNPALVRHCAACDLLPRTCRHPAVAWPADCCRFIQLLFLYVRSQILFLKIRSWAGSFGFFQPSGAAFHFAGCWLILGGRPR
jgi:hypothetical protein